jgi:hypothetical protein
MYLARSPWRVHSVLLAVLTLGLATLSSRAKPNLSPANLAITAPDASGVTLAELDEYATQVLGDPWDMNEPSDLAYYRSDSGMSNSVFSGGVYSALMADRDGSGAERITLLTNGSKNNAAMRIGHIKQLPGDTGRLFAVQRLVYYRSGPGQHWAAIRFKELVGNDPRVAN